MPAPREKNLRVYLRIISYLKPYIRKVALAIVCNIFFVIFSTLSVWMIAPVITALFQEPRAATEQTAEPGTTAEPDEGRTPPSTSFNINRWLTEKTRDFFQREDRLEMLKLLCLFIFASFSLKNFFGFGEFYLISFVEQKVIKDLREQVYEHILKQPMQFFTSHQTGGLISRITNDINAVNVAVNRGFTKLIRDPVLIFIYLFFLFSISWRLTLASLVIVPLSVTLIQQIGQSLKRKSKRVQERISDITTLLQEAISGIHVVKAFAMENYENRRFRNYNDSHFTAVLRQVRLRRLASPLSETMGVAVIAVVVWYGGHLVLAGQSLSSENFIRFIILLFSLMEPIKSLGDLNNNIQIALASGNRIFEVLDTPVTITDRENAIVKSDFNDRITFEDVYFRYKRGGPWILKNIELEVNRFEKVALVGSSGAGKTTLVNLLPRFYDVDRGAIRIDGIDIRDISMNSLRNMMGIVTQEVMLFNDTIANNIAYGNADFPPDRIEHAARMANAYDFVMEMPDGFQSVVGERGVMLSGGQRQRISIARAILKNPPILIFDEATSSLDSESENLIQEAIENLMRERTVFLIAHRLSSVIHSDKIVVLENGRIVDVGDHQTLLGASDRYRQLYELQFATE